MAKVCVIGSATWDAVLTTNQAKVLKPSKNGPAMMAFSYGAKIDASSTVYTFGGGAANVAVGLSRLGIPTGVHTHLGSDWRGKEIINHLKKEGVNVGGITFDSKRHSATALIVTSGAATEHVAFVDRGASSGLVVEPSLANSGCQWFYLTAITSPKWYSHLTNFLKLAARRKKKIFWNPGTMQLQEAKKLRPLLKYLAVLDLNLSEGITLAKELGIKVTKPADLLIKLRKLGPKIIIITAGSNGAYAYDGVTMVHYPSFHVKATNTIGAGDAFGSGWLAGYIHSRGNIKTAMHWGMCNSNAVILKPGAQIGLLKKSEIRRWRQNIAKDNAN